MAYHDAMNNNCSTRDNSQEICNLCKKSECSSLMSGWVDCSTLCRCCGDPDCKELGLLNPYYVPKNILRVMANRMMPSCIDIQYFSEKFRQGIACGVPECVYREMPRDMWQYITKKINKFPIIYPGDGPVALTSYINRSLMSQNILEIWRVCTCSRCNNACLFASAADAQQKVNIVETDMASFLNFELGPGLSMRVPITNGLNIVGGIMNSHNPHKFLGVIFTIYIRTPHTTVPQWNQSKKYIARYNRLDQTLDKIREMCNAPKYYDISQMAVDVLIENKMTRSYKWTFQFDHIGNIVVCIQKNWRSVAAVISMRDLQHAFEAAAAWLPLYNQPRANILEISGPCYYPMLNALGHLADQSGQIMDIFKKRKELPAALWGIIVQYTGERWYGPLKKSPMRSLFFSTTYEPSVLNIIGQYVFG
jgi:hypothetical protein